MTMEVSAAALEFQQLMLPLKSVKIIVLNEHGEQIKTAAAEGTASGFIRRESTGFFLYTAWHVVAGISRRERRLPYDWERPMALRVGLRSNESSLPGVEAIKQSRDTDLPLYSSDSVTPCWAQDRLDIADAELNRAGLRIPKLHDAVKLRLSDIDVSHRLAVEAEPSFDGVLLPGDQALIVGYPSSNDDATRELSAPLVLTRFLATNRIDRQPQQFLIDGRCIDGFAGAPIYVERASRLFVVGLYAGPIGAARDVRDPGFGVGCNLTLCWSQPYDFGLTVDQSERSRSTREH
jgi:hypothetical protein